MTLHRYFSIALLLFYPRLALGQQGPSEEARGAAGAPAGSATGSVAQAPTAAPPTSAGEAKTDAGLAAPKTAEAEKVAASGGPGSTSPSQPKSQRQGASATLSAVQKQPVPSPATAASGRPHQGRFSFGSYGRVVAATDGRGQPGRNADVVAYGSRLDHANYVELELRREDRWRFGKTRMVATMAFGHPVFHYNGDFDARLALRNLFLEASDLGTKGFSLWAGSRMQRGDDIYLMDWWPLDNLNTMGGGARYARSSSGTYLQLHMGLAQPNNPFYKQQASRPMPLNRFGAATVDILNRQRWVGSARVEQHLKLGGEDSAAGLKFVAYGEGHRLPRGQREQFRSPGTYEDVPAEGGFVLGAQVGLYRGSDASHLNLFVRYAKGVAAYGAFASPEGLALDRSTSGAREWVVALGGNLELGSFALQGGAYYRSFRNASVGLDFGDHDEGHLIARPAVWFLPWLGLAVEGSYQVQQRGVLAAIEPDLSDGSSTAERDPLLAGVGRVGVIPFVSPKGRGTYSRPTIWFIYSLAMRNDAARMLYPVDDNFRSSRREHFAGFGAEWWFSSSSYARGE